MLFPKVCSILKHKQINFRHIQIQQKKQERQSEIISKTANDIERGSESEIECEQDGRENERHVQNIIREMEIENEF